MITGEDLVNLGYKPGKWFGEALVQANARELSGENLKAFLEKLAPKPMPLPAKPASFHQNIRAENEAETANVKSVVAIMETLMHTPTLGRRCRYARCLPNRPKQYTGWWYCHCQKRHSSGHAQRRYLLFGNGHQPGESIAGNGFGCSPGHNAFWWRRTHRIFPHCRQHWNPGFLKTGFFITNAV